MHTVLNIVLFALVFVIAARVLFAAVAAFLFVISRRSTRAYAMINQVLSVTPTKTGQVLFPSSVTLPGTPMLVGSIPAINLDAYQSTIGGATCYFDGCYALTVQAYSTSSPLTGKTINIGDPIYATGGTLDSATNVTTGFTLDADSGDNSVLWGYLDSSNAGPLASGTVAVVNVRIADKV